MANSSHPKPKISLKPGHSLVGRDTFPLVLQLKALDREIEPQDMASINAKYLLESYSEQELRKEFRKLTGHLVSDIIEAAGLDDSHDMVRDAVHVAVTQANLAGVPPNLSGGTQTLRDPDVPSDSGTAPVQATNNTAQPTGQAEGPPSKGGPKKSSGPNKTKDKRVSVVTTVYSELCCMGRNRIRQLISVCHWVMVISGASWGLGVSSHAGHILQC